MGLWLQEEATNVSKHKRLAVIGSKAFEEAAFAVDTFRVPGLGKMQDQAVKGFFLSSDKLRVGAGLPRKRHRRVVAGGVVEL